MLTRLKVQGFKNLADVDIRFGPFTCIAGANGVGKSNLFDAIAFLTALADKPLMEAAMAVRGGEAWRGDLRSLFTRRGDQVGDRMRFEVELIIPARGEDALGQPAEASATFLHYTLELRHRADPYRPSAGAIEVAFEQLTHINRSEARARLGFPHTKAWRDSVVLGRRTSPYISTDEEEERPVISLHADSKGGLGGGRPRKVPAASLPRTVLSSVNNAAEHRTLVLARAEMMRWTQLQLEPSALRTPDGFTALAPEGTTLRPNGAHLPATLYGLTRRAQREHAKAAAPHADAVGAEAVLARVANRLSALVENVRSVDIDIDEKRQLLSLVLTDRFHTRHVASALSDGTLRFLALTVMEVDPRQQGLLCLEEPENGIHPRRIEAMIELLTDLAVDAREPVGEDNPLRQVIINTHAPAVVAAVPDDALLVATGPETWQWQGARLRGLPETWRDRDPAGVVAKGKLLAYLNPHGALDPAPRAPGHRRVKDRPDLQQLLPLFAAEPGCEP